MESNSDSQAITYHKEFRMLTLRVRVLVYVLVVLSVFVAQLTDRQRLDAARRDARREAFAAANARALVDTTRDVARSNHAIAQMLGDSLRLVERQVQQLVQTRDTIDRALGEERIARYSAELSVDSLEARLMAAGARRATAEPGAASASRDFNFSVRQAPFTVGAHVEFVPVLDTARLTVSVVLDSASLHVRAACGTDFRGVRSAVIQLQTPAWLRARIEGVEQSPALCMSAASEEHLRSPRLTIPRIIAGAGRLYPFSGRSGWGLFLGGGIALGR